MRSRIAIIHYPQGLDFINFTWGYLTQISASLAQQFMRFFFVFVLKMYSLYSFVPPPPIVAPSYPPETWISQSWIYPTRGYLKKISFLGQMVYENIFQKFFYFYLFLNNCVWKRWSLIFTLLKPPWLTILSTKFSYHWFCFRVEEICFFFLTFLLNIAPLLSSKVNRFTIKIFMLQ